MCETVAPWLDQRVWDPFLVQDLFVPSWLQLQDAIAQSTPYCL